jgi:single-strand DNA-binding protein
MDNSTQEPNDDNQVFLRGRLAAPPEIRELPSGDEICSFRLTVRRPPGDRVRVDSVDCSTTRARVRRTVERAAPGDQFELTGSLHRRFWRGAAGVASRYEVDVSTAKITGRQSGASPARMRASA